MTEQIWEWLWKYWPGRVVVFAVSLLLLAGAIMTAVNILTPLLPEEEAMFPANPVVLTIQPDLPAVSGYDRDFGDLHIDGLRLALDGTDPFIKVVPIRASSQDMKNARLDVVFAEVDKHLAKRNVIAVVGPSITEATTDIVEHIHDKNPDLPIIIESSATKQRVFGSVQRPSNTLLAVFRLSSGVDERGREVAHVLNHLLGERTRVSLVIEELKNGIRSYGELMRDVAKDTFERDYETASWYEIREVVVRRGAVLASQGLLDTTFAESDVVVFLGMGSDFRVLAERYCPASGNAAPTKLVGVMCAYVVDKPLRDGALRAESVLEITDMAFEAVLNPPVQLADFLGRFAPTDQRMSPALRDQAFSFDAGLIIEEALRHVLSTVNDVSELQHQDGLRQMARYIHDIEFNGVTGRISFMDGQNRGEPLRLCRYSPTTREWVTVGVEYLVTRRP